MAYQYQFQIAPDVSGSPGTWADVGSLSTATTVDATAADGLRQGHLFWARCVVHDSLTTVNSSPVQFQCRRGPYPGMFGEDWQLGRLS